MRSAYKKQSEQTLLLHVIGGWKGNNWGGQINSRLILDEIIIQILVRWAVPCFMMISGYLLLPPRKTDVSFKKLKNYIFRMLIILVTFGFGFCLIEILVTNKDLSLVQIIGLSLLNLLGGKSWSHMWYVYMLIGMYLIVPILRAFVQLSDEKTMKCTLLFLFCFTSIIPTINKLFEINIICVIPFSTCYIFYFLAGYYFGNHSYKIIKKFAVTFLMIGILGFTLMLVLLLLGYNVSYNSDNVFVALYSISIFVLASRSEVVSNMSKNCIIKDVSKYSFGIYILHPVILNVLNKGLNLFPDIMPIFVGERLLLKGWN